MTEADGNLVDRFQAAMAVGEKKQLAGLIHPDFEVVQSRALPYGGSYRGRDGFFQFVEIFFTAWQIESFTLEQRYEAPVTDPSERDFVILFRLVGSSLKTGERIDTTLAEQWTFKEGMLRFAKPHWFEPPGIRA